MLENIDFLAGTVDSPDVQTAILSSTHRSRQAGHLWCQMNAYGKGRVLHLGDDGHAASAVHDHLEV